jgi:hypothetical protein
MLIYHKTDNLNEVMHLLDKSWQFSGHNGIALGKGFYAFRDRKDVERIKSLYGDYIITCSCDIDYNDFYIFDPELDNDNLFNKIEKYDKEIVNLYKESVLNNIDLNQPEYMVGISVIQEIVKLGERSIISIIGKQGVIIDIKGYKEIVLYDTNNLKFIDIESISNNKKIKQKIVKETFVNL